MSGGAFVCYLLFAADRFHKGCKSGGCGSLVGGGRRWGLEVGGGVDGEAFVRHLFR